MANPAVIRIFDTTLRDGEQSPGATLTLEEKLQVVDQLVRLRVDVIEVGFPAASPGDLIAVKEIAYQARGVAVAALARANINDINAAREALREAEHPVIHIFHATSAIHLKHRLNSSAEHALQSIKAMVTYARNLCPTVEFSAEDATRSDLDYLCQVCEVVMQAGATTINLPDTVGYATPTEYGELFRSIRERVPSLDEITLSAHCHNDLGMATANTLAAIVAGARQVEVTLNGLGERAGNTAMEEVVMTLRTRPEQFGHATSRIDPREFVRSSQLVSNLTGIPVQPNKAIVGANAFSPEFRVQRNGLLKNRLTYEIMTPTSVGRSLVLGKHSGWHELEVRLSQLGYSLNSNELRVAYSRFVTLADQKKYATDADLIYIAETSQETPMAV